MTTTSVSPATKPKNAPMRFRREKPPRTVECPPLDGDDEDETDDSSERVPDGRDDDAPEQINTPVERQRHAVGPVQGLKHVFEEPHVAPPPERPKPPTNQAHENGAHPWPPLNSTNACWG